jgi:hypothetical protein
MAFQDNSGDIILDAVLTDAGRRAMARGDGTFKINHFKLGDDEINYENFNLDHTGGSPYYDLEILQTPILEALTNNEVSLNSKLISYTNPNLLYLPQLILNTEVEKSYGKDVGFFQYDPAKETFIVACTVGTARAMGAHAETGVLNGVFPGQSNSRIRLEFGIDTPGKTPGPLKGSNLSELNEDSFYIEYDSRFCQIANVTGETQNGSFVDEDAIQLLLATAGSDLVTEMNKFDDSLKPHQPKIRWLRGNKIEFKIMASDLLQSGDPDSSKSLWQKHGTQDTGTDWDTTAATIGNSSTCYTAGGTNDIDAEAAAGTLWRIDSYIRVSGVYTGASIDVPVRFYKSKEFVDCSN